MRAMLVFPLWHTSPSSLNVFCTEISSASPYLASSSRIGFSLLEVPAGRQVNWHVGRETLEFRTLSLCASRLTAFDAELMLSFGGRRHGLSLVGYWIASFCGDRL
jgi:hypothetical protein